MNNNNKNPIYTNNITLKKKKKKTSRGTSGNPFWEDTARAYNSQEAFS